MAASDLYEVRCESCRTSFPPEARRCIHCGGPLGPSRRLVSAGLPGGAAPAEEVDPEELPFQRGRSAVWVATAVIALLLSALRGCQLG